MGGQSLQAAEPDGIARRLIKALVRGVFLFELSLRRRTLRLFRDPLYSLAGTCQRCAKCCELPTLALPALLYVIKPLRALVIAWQWHVNRFALARTDDDSRTLSFHCAHFDWSSRGCRNYASRPAMCRDYPRFLLDQLWPDLFDECGYRAVSRSAESLAHAIDKVDLSPEQREKLKRRLHVLR